ncbi:MAG TPA: hypothetical protein VIY29_27725 [Ktedonobacteraceae bacterium]
MIDNSKNLPTLQPKIVRIQPLVVPTPMGSMAIIMYGLGDDSKLYQWEGKSKKWVLSN